MAKIKLDDLDKGFGLGTIFGIGATATVFLVGKAYEIVRRMKSSQRAFERLCKEVDENIEARERREGY